MISARFSPMQSRVVPLKARVRFREPLTTTRTWPRVQLAALQPPLNNRPSKRQEVEETRGHNHLVSISFQQWQTQPMLRSNKSRIRQGECTQWWTTYSSTYSKPTRTSKSVSVLKPLLILDQFKSQRLKVVKQQQLQLISRNSWSSSWFNSSNRQDKLWLRIKKCNNHQAPSHNLSCNHYSSNLQPQRRRQPQR